MAEIRVEYDSHMGDCLKVCRMAKDSFGRTTEWEYALDPEEETGWEFHTESTSGDVYRRLSDKDQRLLKMLARGMGEDEYQEALGQIRLYASHEEYDEGAEWAKGQFEAAVWKFRNTTPHLAPFGHNFITFKFQAPVFVMRQIVKHEYIRISELSMRYVRGMPEYYRPKSWRAVAEDVKQGSGGDISGVPAHMLYKHLDDCSEYDSDEYESFIDKDGKYKLAPEQARMFLRLCHMTQGHISGSMDAIAGLVTKRLDLHAQEETREFARQIERQCRQIWPWSWPALMEGCDVSA